MREKKLFKNFKILGLEDSVYIGRSRMLTSVRNALWVADLRALPKMVASYTMYAIEEIA